MDISVQKTGMRGKALCILSGGRLLCYRKGGLVIYSLEDEARVRSCRLPMPAWKRLLCKVRLLERLLHMEVRWAEEIGENRVLFQFGSGIWLLNCETGSISQENVPVKGKPLSICKVENIAGFTDSYLIGDYTAKRDGLPVSIYQREADTQQWRCCYAFPAGAVRHIHGFSVDAKNQCVYILTGDEDDESGIWTARDQFRDVRPYLVGKQQYRTCQMLSTGGGQCYLTDAPSEQNHLYQIQHGVAIEAASIPGTCIYGTATPWGGVYSTACEPEAHARNRLDYWLSNRPGRGIEGRQVQVFGVDAAGCPEVFMEFEHDGLPLRLFQYGTVSFTRFVEETCYCTPMCVRKYDMKVFCIKNMEQKA